MADFLEKLNPLTSCQKYHLPLWQCPPFLFLVMGLVIAGGIIATYLVAAFSIGDPRIVALLVLLVSAILFVIDYIIINSFERVAEASRMKTEFIGVVSHQLRSPLTNLKFALDLLMSGKLSRVGEGEVEYFKILRENTQRMGDLINDLIVVSRIESGEFPLKKGTVSVQEVAEKLIKKNKLFAQASNVTLNFHCQKDLPQVIADPLWLEQIIKNLLDNAIRYTKGKGDVNVDLSKEGKGVLFKIEDHGVGIPKEEQKFIFRKFFRSKNAVRHQTEGSGLGLHIAQRIVKLFGGKIWFDSTEGKGTTFYFILPVEV